jgi:hypothetical protein
VNVGEMGAIVQSCKVYLLTDVDPQPESTGGVTFTHVGLEWQAVVSSQSIQIVWCAHFQRDLLFLRPLNN